MEVDDAVVVLLVVDVVLVVVSSDVVEVDTLVEGVVKSRIPGTADGTEGKNNFSHPQNIGHIHRGKIFTYLGNVGNKTWRNKSGG